MIKHCCMSLPLQAPDTRESVRSMLPRKVVHVRLYRAEGEELVSEDTTLTKLYKRSLDSMALDCEAMRQTHKYRDLAVCVSAFCSVVYECKNPALPGLSQNYRSVKFVDGTIWMRKTDQGSQVCLFPSEEVWLLFFQKYMRHHVAGFFLSVQEAEALGSAGTKASILQLIDELGCLEVDDEWFDDDGLYDAEDDCVFDGQPLTVEMVIADCLARGPVQP